MISRHGNKQPPHPLSGSFKGPEEQDICPFCRERVFTADLYSELSSARTEDSKSLEIEYRRSTQELHTSVLVGCGWCTILARGVLTAAHLDYWYNHWNGSHSDGSSMDDEQDEEGSEATEAGELEGEYEMCEPEGDDNQSEVEAELTLTLSDFEKTLGQLSVRLWFVKNDNVVIYTAVEAMLALSWDKPEHNSRLKDVEDVRMSFEVFLKPGTRVPLPLSSTTKPVSLNSEQTYQLARSWIRACEDHEQCRSKPEDYQPASFSMEPKPCSIRIPRYLIEVDHASGPRVVLHRSLPEQASYVALSYVWGTNQTYVLTKKTLQEKCSGLDHAQVPKTISDAMNVTKQLGYSFLWVDALCIVQDDRENMADEISSMGKIYRDSEVTIIAANAPSSTDGFLGVSESPYYFVEPFDVPLQTESKIEQLLSVGYRSYYKPFKDPINSRAWTLQERILSTRCLVYSYDGLKWICRTCEKNPSAPWDAPSMFPRMALPNNLAVPAGTDTNGGIRQTWLDIRAEYTRRNLTNDEDKLPAISAIAFEIAKLTGWSYLVGLWKEHLFTDLQWRCDRHTTTPTPGEDSLSNPLRPRPPKYRAPSWSWASIDGPIVDADESYGFRENFHFRIVSCDIEYRSAARTGDFPFEPVKSGTLVVEGRIIGTDWQWSDPSDLADAQLIYQEQGTTYICGDITFDASEPTLNSGTKLFCLAMSVLKSNRTRWPIEGLLLLPENEPETYRRVGLFETYSTTIFDGVRERLSTII